MDLETFLVAVYCETDDALRTMLHGARLRQRGPGPRLADSEVLAMEVAGEFLGVETDRGIYRYFRQHWRPLFPAPAAVHRTTFPRRAANLWAVKRALWQALLPQLRGDAHLSIVDSVPVPVCRFARAKQCRLFPGAAAYGRDPCLPGTFFGLRAHPRVTWPGVIAEVALAPANAADLALAPAVLAGATGWALSDRSYFRVLEPRPARAAAGGRRRAARAVPDAEVRAGAVAALARQHAPAHRDRPRATGRALPKHAHLGARPLAPAIAVAAQGAQPRDGRAPLPAARPRLPRLQSARHDLRNVHTALVRRLARR